MENERQRPQTRVQRDGYELVVLHKQPAEIANEAQACARLKHLPEYELIEVCAEARSVGTPFGTVFRLTTVDRLLQALDALRKIHLCGVIHSDLKEEHLLERQGQLFFIDFAFAVFEPGATNVGYSYFFASAPMLKLHEVHPLDDYEALFMSALSEIDYATPEQWTWFPPYPDQRAPRSEWVRWKRELVEYVLTRLRTDAAAAAEATEPELSLDASLAAAAYRGLMMVWEMPRLDKFPTDMDHWAVMTTVAHK